MIEQLNIFCIMCIWLHISSLEQQIMIEQYPMFVQQSSVDAIF